MKTLDTLDDSTAGHEALDPALRRIVEQVQQAHAQGTPLEIRGGGTKRFYGNATPEDKASMEILDTRALQGVLQYEPSELVVTVRTGTPLAELEALLDTQGQCLAFEPPRLGDPGVGTVGGMVAAGLAGPSRAAVGGVRDFVLGASMINGRGEWLHFGGQVMKNVAGYDVSRLLAGSMGVLGVITDVSLKVLPRPVATATLRFDCDEAEALERMNGWAGQPWPIHATAWWNGTLVVRLSGAHAAVRFARDRLGGELVDAELARAFWQGLRDQTDEYFEAAASSVAQGGRLWRLSVPDTTGPLNLQGDTLMEWGGAQRWLCTDAPPEEVRDLVDRRGGHAALYRAEPPHVDVFSALSSPLTRVHRQLKAAFDPRGIFNPGRLYAAF